MRGFMRFVRSSRLLMVGAIAFIITLAAALAAFLCDRLGVGVPWLPSGLHAVSALSGLTAGASPVFHCVCSIESGPCERVDVFHVSGRFWSTSACGEKRTPARPAWTSFPS